MRFIIFFATASIFSSLLVHIVKNLSHKYEVFANPTSDRWHKKPIPIHGSFGFITIFFLLLLFSISAFSPDFNTLESSRDIIFPELSFRKLTYMIAIIGSTLLFFLLGFLDDLFSFKASTKFITQILICILFILDTRLFLVSDFYALNFLFTLFWLVGITNASNLIDSFDGVCSSVIITSSLILLFIISTTDIQENDIFYLSAITSILAGCLVGFLVHNFPPASIFMGDSGSLPMGFIIASICIPSELNNFYGYNESFSIMKIIIPIFLLSFPIFDTTLVSISRILNNKNIYDGGKDHTAHRLSSLGISDSVVLLICVSYTFAGGITAYMIFSFPNIMWLIALSFFILSFSFLCYLLRIKTY